MSTFFLTVLTLLSLNSAGLTLFLFEILMKRSAEPGDGRDEMQMGEAAQPETTGVRWNDPLHGKVPPCDGKVLYVLK